MQLELIPKKNKQRKIIIYRIPSNTFNQATVPFECGNRLEAVHAPNDDAVIDTTARQISIL